MKLQSEAFLEKARELLEQAEAILRIGYADAAGRTAYLAGYHAAQALIFEREDRVLKTHRGVQAEFVRLSRENPSFDLDLRAFLGRTYNLKAIADYEAGPGARVSPAQAAEAIVAARRFIGAIAKALAESYPL